MCNVFMWIHLLPFGAVVWRLGDGLFNFFYLFSSLPSLYVVVSLNSVKCMMQKWIFLSSANISLRHLSYYDIYDIYQNETISCFSTIATIGCRVNYFLCLFIHMHVSVFFFLTYSVLVKLRRWLPIPSTCVCSVALRCRRNEIFEAHTHTHVHTKDSILTLNLMAYVNDR